MLTYDKPLGQRPDGLARITLQKAYAGGTVSSMPEAMEANLALPAPAAAS